jgi:uncharacterized membrane protein YciS (DUF1049 family)
LLLIIILGVTFAVLNSNAVGVNYYIGHSTLPLSLLLAGVLASGCLLGLLVGMWLLFKLKIKNFRLHQQLKLAEKEIENLRAIPLQDKH